jgi:hypothetical protein
MVLEVITETILYSALLLLQLVVEAVREHQTQPTKRVEMADLAVVAEQ